MPQQQHPSILLLGDSITQFGSDPTLSGFHSLLQRDYIRRADVVNRGLSGYNTKWVLSALEEILDDAYGNRIDPILVTVFLGANDATPCESSQHVSLEDYEQNLRNIHQILRTSFPSAKLLFLTPTPISESRTCGRNNTTAGKYSAACLKVGQSLGVPVINLWSIMQDDIDSYLCDGLHLTAKGNVTVYNSLVQEIASQWPELVPNALPFYFPSWVALAEAEAVHVGE